MALYSSHNRQLSNAYGLKTQSNITFANVTITAILLKNNVQQFDAMISN